MEKLTYNEFKEAIKDYFSKRMDHAEIQLTTNDTVNQKIDYLTIREKDATVSPSLRLNDSYKQYLDCKCEEESFFETIYEQVVNAAAKDRISFENLDNLFVIKMPARKELSWNSSMKKEMKSYCRK